ncbi:MAG: UDP-N-acetylmuramoyl-L-alanine--D-glutamate ligase [Bacillota bacterium]
MVTTVRTSNESTRAALERLGRERLAVIGLGLNNAALVRLLLRQGAQVTVFDRKSREEMAGRLAELGPGLAGSPNLSLSLGPDYLSGLRGFDRIFLTPGMRKDLPEIRTAAREGTAITGDFELFFELCAAPITAVTGSAGKTTTTTLVGLILEAEYAGKKPVYVGGNIGRPLIDRVLEIPAEAEVVLEMSSYQLQLVTRSPEVGAILNLSPNHLDVHASMEEYVQAKANIIRFQGAEGWGIFNFDDSMTKAIGSARAQGGKPGGPGVAWFSSQAGPADLPAVAGKSPAPAAVLDGDELVVRGPAGAAVAGAAAGAATGVFARVCSRSELIIPGEHNVQNALAAMVAAALRGAGPEAARRVLTTFRGVAHRLELVAEHGGVRYINDSIATTPERTEAALRTLGPVAPLILILGGYDKGLPFDEMARLIIEPGWVKATVLAGKTAGKIDEALARAAEELGRPRPENRTAHGFDEAVAEARGLAADGDIVLLSPACASYDLFTNFEARGRRFAQLVQA